MSYLLRVTITDNQGDRYVDFSDVFFTAKRNGYAPLDAISLYGSTNLLNSTTSFANAYGAGTYPWHSNSVNDGLPFWGVAEFGDDVAPIDLMLQASGFPDRAAKRLTTELSLDGGEHWMVVTVEENIPHWESGEQRWFHFDIHGWRAVISGVCSLHGAPWRAVLHLLKLSPDDNILREVDTVESEATTGEYRFIYLEPDVVYYVMARAEGMRPLVHGPIIPQFSE